MLVTNERIEFNVHVLLIPLKHISSQVAYRSFSFPAALPEAYFTP